MRTKQGPPTPDMNVFTMNITEMWVTGNLQTQLMIAFNKNAVRYR